MTSVSNDLPTRLPSAILFDLDGTLLDSASDLTYAIGEMLEALGYPKVGIEKIVTWVGNGLQKLIERALVDAKLNLSEMSDIYPKAKQVFDRAYNEACETPSGLYPGVRELLSYCNEQALPIALITNKPEHYTHMLLNGLDLASHFGAIIGGDTLAEKKPSALPLLHAAKTLNVDITDCWMVGDSASDVEAAKAAGCPVVGLTYGYNHGRPISVEAPNWLCDSLKELQDRLVNLYSQSSALV
ncbi:phosphoglycolate phosphatase [Litoribrevibacter euphylliae]|uniref:phosphoglycolate phosphatase n=1 Tax=Litoribrevibacter euphylliae TaxID=1834034 RepID=A0ABV7HHG6_9GAMM